MEVLGLSYYGSGAASTRVRLQQFREPLAKLGIDLTVRPFLGDWYIAHRYGGKSGLSCRLLADVARRTRDLLSVGRYDLAIVSRELLPLMPAGIERLLLSTPYVYDLDDANYLLYRYKGPTPRIPLLAHKIDALISGAAAVSAGNRTLAEYTNRLNPQTFVVPSVVNTELYKCRQPGSQPRVVVGWIGTPKTVHFLRALEAPLARMALKHAICLRVVGAQAPTIVGCQTESIPWSEAHECELIRSFDIGVMPLTDDEWSRGKCAYKLIQCMASGVPVTASPVGANQDVVTPECGFLAADEEEWVGALERLVVDASLRASMGEAGRARVEQHYSIAAVAPLLAQVMTNAASRR